MSDNWVLHIKGYGEGCDYTIGCNQRTVSFEGTEDVALQRARDEIGHSFLEDQPPRQALLYRVLSVVDMKTTIHEVVEERDTYKRDRETAKKRAEFERLKRELGE